MTTITISGEIYFKWQQYPPKKVATLFLLCVDIVNRKRSDWTYEKQTLHYFKNKMILNKIETLLQNEYRTSTEECKFGNVHM